MKDKFLTATGYILLALGVVGIIANIYTETTNFIIWFCNHTVIILGLAFLFRSRFWITAELSIALIPQVFWSMDFLSKLLFNKYIFGFTSYMFSPDYNPLLYYLSLDHLIITPIALIGLWYLGKPVWAWEGSLLHGVLLMIPSYIFANGDNLNCMWKSCVPFIPTTTLYPILWPLIFVFLVILPTNWLLIKGYARLRKKYKKKKRKK